MSDTVATPIEIPTGTWVIDPKHSAVTFQIKHMGFARIHGRFRVFTGQIDVPAEAGTFVASGEIDARTIDTNQERRDAHLRSPDFFDVERFPTIGFSTATAEFGDDMALRLTGPLTMHGVTQEIELNGTIAGLAKGHDGQQRLGLSVSGAIDRSAFGIDYNRVVEGLIMLPHHVEITLDLQATPEG